MQRRFLLAGLPLLVAAPAIVRAQNLMPVRVPRLSLDDLYERAARLGCDLLVEHEGQEAVALAYPPSPQGPSSLNRLARERSIVIGRGRLALPGNCFFDARYSAQIPAEIRSEIFRRNDRDWHWRAA